MEYVVIDSNAIGYIGQSNKRLSTGDHQATQSIYHCAKAFPEFHRMFPKAQIVSLWDKHCQWRYDLLPEYKGKRDSTPEQRAMRAEYKTQRPYIQKMLTLFGMKQWACDGYEADDLAGYLARKVMSTGGKMTVVTRDKDWLQLVNALVSWYSPVDKVLITAKNFHEYTGYVDGVAFLQGKALQGDTSDNISGVGGLGKETAPKVLARFGSVKHMLAAHKANGDFSPEELEHGGINLRRSRKKINDFCKNIKGGLDIYKRNIKLMNLLQHTDKPPSKIERSELDEEGLLDLYAELGFNALVMKLPSFIKMVHPSYEECAT